MLSLARRLQTKPPWLFQLAASDQQLRYVRNDAFGNSGSAPHRRRPKFTATKMKKDDDKSEWWIVDGEMHEIGENVPLRERFVIPRDNIPNKRRKQLREQFMRRTRLVIKESEQEPWCKRYMELYNELRENWERLYWDEGYSKKIASDHANYDSAEDDEGDFSPYRGQHTYAGQVKEQGFVKSRQPESWEKVRQVRDKFEYDREQRMRAKAFAPMNVGDNSDNQDTTLRNQPFDTQKYFSSDEED